MGALWYAFPMPGKPDIDLAGSVIGFWSVLSYAGRGGMWHVKCRCGLVAVRSGFALRNSKTKSCGCEKGGLISNAITKNKDLGKVTDWPEYHAWAGMKDRCGNPNSIGFKYWGGRGIKVHPKWISSFRSFYNDVGPTPGKGYSLDRFPNKDGNYEPGNVRWATRSEQSKNRRPWKRGCKYTIAIRKKVLSMLCGGMRQIDVTKKLNLPQGAVSRIAVCNGIRKNKIHSMNPLHTQPKYDIYKV